MIHETAIVHPGATLAENVDIGPFAVIGEHVSIGSGTWVGPHTVIEGWTDIGQDNKIYQFASIGADPQDLKFAGEQSTLRIGDRNKIREFVTIHRGTEDGGGETIIGSDCLFMAYTHVAHDCRIGNQVILANAATLAGHVEIMDYAILGGLSAVHQFVRIGEHVMASGGSMINQDIPPYTIAQGDRAKTVGINSLGLKRRGFSEEAIRGIKNSYKLVYRADLKQDEALKKIVEQYASIPEVMLFVDFIKGSERGLAR